MSRWFGEDGSGACRFDHAISYRPCSGPRNRDRPEDRKDGPIASRPFTLAHLSDPHLGPEAPSPGSAPGNAPDPPPRMTLKQRLALRNWRRRRRHILQADIAHLTARDIAAAAPDHVVMTGDIANVGLPAEFNAAIPWLETLCGSIDREMHNISIVPGNHDALARGCWEAGAARLGLATQSYPWCRRVGPVALIGLSTAVPTLPLLATGRLGAQQIDAAAEILTATAVEGLCRIVLIHHPPGETTKWRRSLTDRHALKNALSTAGAEVVLYGHNHRSEEVRIGSTGILALGVPAASAATGTATEPAGWHAIAIDGGPGAWRATVTLRRLQPTGTFAAEWTRSHSL
ncbi:MAG: metallophosphoesterase [Pseudomonadota bacterium]